MGGHHNHHYLPPNVPTQNPVTEHGGEGHPIMGMSPLVARDQLEEDLLINAFINEEAMDWQVDLDEGPENPGNNEANPANNHVEQMEVDAEEIVNNERRLLLSAAAPENHHNVEVDNLQQQQLLAASEIRDFPVYSRESLGALLARSVVLRKQVSDFSEELANIYLRVPPPPPRE